MPVRLNIYLPWEKSYQIHPNGLVQNEHRKGEVYFQVDAERNAVDDVRLHPMEDLSCNLDRGND
jgi:hypothetical protein